MKAKAERDRMPPKKKCHPETGEWSTNFLGGIVKKVVFNERTMGIFRSFVVVLWFSFMG